MMNKISPKEKITIAVKETKNTLNAIELPRDVSQELQRVHALFEKFSTTPTIESYSHLISQVQEARNSLQDVATEQMYVATLIELLLTLYSAHTDQWTEASKHVELAAFFKKNKFSQLSETEQNQILQILKKSAITNISRYKKYAKTAA